MGNGLQIPIVGGIFIVLVSLLSFGALAICLRDRLPALRHWRSLALAKWLIIIICIISTFFVATTAVIWQAWGGDGLLFNKTNCRTEILLCLSSYLVTKVLIYFFLVEKAYIVSGSMKPRLQSKLYIFNFFVMAIPFLGLSVFTFFYRVEDYKNSKCVLGIQRKAALPIMLFDVCANIYLTGLFIIPIRSLHAYNNNSESPLRPLAKRTFIGVICTLTTSVINLTVTIALNGETSWICMMSCNTDVLITTLILNWVTSKDATIEPWQAIISGPPASLTECTRCTSIRHRPSVWPPPVSFLGTLQTSGNDHSNDNGISRPRPASTGWSKISPFIEQGEDKPFCGIDLKRGMVNKGLATLEEVQSSASHSSLASDEIQSLKSVDEKVLC